MNKINVNNRSFIIKKVVPNNINDELREQLKKKHNVNTILKDNNNNLLFVDEIIDANIISEEKYEI